MEYHVRKDAKMSLYDEIASRLDFRDGQLWAEADKVEKGMIAAHEISGAVLATYRALRGTPVQQDELEDAIKKIYREYIQPLDIPGVGPVIENFVDAYAGQVLGGLVKATDAWLDKKGL